MTASFSNLEPSLALNQVVVPYGEYPNNGTGHAYGDTVGFVYNYAGVTVPDGSFAADGQLLSIDSYEVLYTLIGTEYGGDGQSTFALPNLKGSADVGTGHGYTLGSTSGSSTVTLTNANLPAPQADQPFNNVQPSLPLETLICTSPAASSTAAFLGQVVQYAGAGSVPDGWMLCTGQTLSIASNAALFAVIGKAYGGDGITSFQLPDAQGRVIVGATNPLVVGQQGGTATDTLSSANLPPTDAPVNNDQPFVTMNYLICVSGSSEFSLNTPTLGEVVAFAGTVVPAGWIFAEGQTLSIASNQALFNILKTTYGGDGVTTFDLPDLSGRTVIGTGMSTDGTNYVLGGQYGSDSTVLQASNIPCYCRGTRLRTSSGEVAVEDLQVGALLLTAAGAERAVRWLGHRRIDCSRHPDPRAIWPVRIGAGAFADDIPARDLWVSPGHSVLVDGVLIQAIKIINGATIVQVPRPRVEYWHVELETHDCLVAEGLAAESYLDTGNRTAFVGGGAYVEMKPDFAPKHWAETCAPLVFEGAIMQKVRGDLRECAVRLGFELTPDPDLHAVVDGTRIEPMRLSANRLAFVFPEGASQIELRSRTFVPAQIHLDNLDPRTLGICVFHLQIDGERVALDDETYFISGWNSLERHESGREHRWSGERIPLGAGTRIVVIDMHPQPQPVYWRATTPHARQRSLSGPEN